MLEQLFKSEPLINYHFLLRVDALIDVACKSVQAFGNEAEFEYLQEGGVNDYVHMLKKPITSPKVLQIECYATSTVLNAFPLGTKMLTPMILYISKQAENIDINFAKQFIFTGCVVKKITNGELDAERSGLITNTIEIAFETVTAIPNPLVAQGKQWGFSGTDMEGNRAKSATYNQTEVRKNKMNDRKEYRKWEFDGNNPDGKGTKSARVAQDVLKMDL